LNDIRSLAVYTAGDVLLVGIDYDKKIKLTNVRLRSMLSSESKWLGADGEGCP
jgi:hypothetical protein